MHIINNYILGEYILFEIVNDHNYKSSGVFINLQCGVQSLHNIMVINLFNQLIKEPCNTILKETVSTTKYIE